MNENFPEIRVPEITFIKDGKGNIVDATGFSPMEKFVGRYLKHYLVDRFGKPVTSPRFHREAYYVYSYPEIYPKSIWVAPRGFAKSTLNQFFATLYYAIVTKTFGEQLLIGAVQGLAERWLAKIKAELTNNDKLINDFGELSTEKDKNGKWAADEILLTNGERVVARGVGGSMRGLHPRRLAPDDLESDELARSQAQVEKTEDWLRGTVIPMQREEGGVISWTGTFIDEDSVLRRAFYKKGWDDSWYRMIHSAAVDDNGEPAWPGNSIWPEAFSNEFLRVRAREITLRIFMAEYMNMPISSLNPIFRREWIEYFEEKDLPEFMMIILAVDPAISEKDINDETAVIALGVDMSPKRPTENIYILDADHGHWSITDSVRRILEMYRRYKAKYVVVETIAFQQALVSALQREARDQQYFMEITEVKPFKDKVTRAKSVSPLLEQGHVKFRKEQEDLIGQMLAFPRKGAPKDMVDALVHGLQNLIDNWQRVDDYYNEDQEEPTLAFPKLGY